MTMKTVSLLKTASISMMAGMLLLSASSTVTNRHKVGLEQINHLSQSADAVSPNTLHHWPNAILADLEPWTLHHWPNQTTAVADIDPAILHHWPNAILADLDPFTLHHWA